MSWPCNTQIAALLLTLLYAHSCGAGGPVQKGTPQTSNSPLAQSAEAAKIEASWQDQVKNLQQSLARNKTVSKGIVREKFEFLEALLGKEPQAVGNSELRRLQQSPVNYEQMTDYEQTFLQLFIDKYAKEGKRDELVELLSFKCPRYIGYAPLEVALTSRLGADNILILHDSYEKSGNDAAKKMIMRILSDVFRDLRSTNNDDSSFLSASKQWYQEHRGKLVVNPDYRPNSFSPDTQRFFLLKQ
jgi:hypothetical protein